MAIGTSHRLPGSDDVAEHISHGIAVHGLEYLVGSRWQPSAASDKHRYQVATPAT